LADLTAGAASVGDVRALSDPSRLESLAAEGQAQVAHAVASSLDTVFLASVPIVALAFVLALFLPEVPLREATELGGRAEPSSEPIGAETGREDCR